MPEKEIRKCVVAFITDDCGRVLLVWNKRRRWELPGGGVEEGESPFRAVVRELLEETGQYSEWRPEAPTVLRGTPKPGAEYASEIYVFRGKLSREPEHELREYASAEVDGVSFASRAAVLKMGEIGCLSDLASRDVLLEWATRAPS